jgi:hypothetical protein
VSAPGNGDDADTLRMAKRIKQLCIDGYIVRRNDTLFTLTVKGWAVLFAEAEPPMYKPKGKSL